MRINRKVAIAGMSAVMIAAMSAGMPVFADETTAEVDAVTADTGVVADEDTIWDEDMDEEEIVDPAEEMPSMSIKQFDVVKGEDGNLHFAYLVDMDEAAGTDYTYEIYAVDSASYQMVATGEGVSGEPGDVVADFNDLADGNYSFQMDTYAVDDEDIVDTIISEESYDYAAETETTEPETRTDAADESAETAVTEENKSIPAVGIVVAAAGVLLLAGGALLAMKSRK